MKKIIFLPVVVISLLAILYAKKVCVEPPPGEPMAGHVYDGFLMAVEKYAEVLIEHGLVDRDDLDDFFESSNVGRVYGMFYEKFDRIVSSHEGRRFKLAYDKCSDTEACGVQGLRDAARRYFFETKYLSGIYRDERLLVGILAGVFADDGLNHGVEYGNCGSGAYYPEYGINALYSETLDDYLSAVDIQGSAVCFSLDMQLPVSGVGIVWNNHEDASLVMDVYGRDEKGYGDWKLIGRFADYPVYAVGGYAHTFLRFAKAEDYAEFYLKAIDGGSKQRLLVREIRPVLNQDVPMACHDSKFIKGFGVEALQTPSLADYLSAHDLESSALCFFHPGRSVVHGVRIGWHSLQTAGTEIEIYGSHVNGFADGVLIGKFSLGLPDKVGTYYYSDIHFNSAETYPFYRLKFLKGNGEDRLVLRYFSLLAETPIFPESALLEIARNVSASMKYGAGVDSIPEWARGNLRDAAAFVSSQSSAHCGNYSLVFISQLPDSVRWTSYGVRRNGYIHNVVEVELQDGGVYVYDPTSGIEYPCTMESMLNGSCKYDSSPSYGLAHPAFGVYKGSGFFYGAEVIQKSDTADGLIGGYRLLNNL